MFLSQFFARLASSGGSLSAPLPWLIVNSISSKLNINSEQGKKVHHMMLNAKKDKRQFFEDSKKLVKRVIAEIDNKST